MVQLGFLGSWRLRILEGIPGRDLSRVITRAIWLGFETLPAQVTTTLASFARLGKTASGSVEGIAYGLTFWCHLTAVGWQCRGCGSLRLGEILSHLSLGLSFAFALCWAIGC